VIASEPPPGWSTRKIRDVCTLINGRGFKPFEWSDRGLPIIRIQNLNGSNDFNCYDGSYDSKISVKHGDLLFAWSGSRGASFGPHIWRGEDAVLNYHTWKVVPSSSVTTSFLYHALRGITPAIEASAHGASALVHVQKWEMEARKLLFPPLREQVAITAALTDADDLIAALERLIAKKQAIKQGVMQQLLTGRTRLPGFRDAWTDHRLGDVSRIKTGSRNNQDKKLGGKYPFFVRSATVEHINTYSYDCEAILVPGEGGIGSIFHYIDGKFEIHQRVYKISDFSPGANGRFIYCYMRQHFGAHAMENSVKATVDSLRLPTFRNFVVKLPSSDEQDAIVRVVDDVETELITLNDRLQKALAIKTGMMQQLLTGRTRLPVDAAP